MNGIVSRALSLEPRLVSLDILVRSLVAHSAPDKELCTGCLWERSIKPLAYGLVGAGRGEVPQNARQTEGFTFRTVDYLLERRDSFTSAETDEERFLRDQATYDAVTDRWLEMLDNSDAASGHGIAGVDNE